MAALGPVKSTFKEANMSRKGNAAWIMVQSHQLVSKMSCDFPQEKCRQRRLLVSGDLIREDSAKYIVSRLHNNVL